MDRGMHRNYIGIAIHSIFTMSKTFHSNETKLHLSIILLGLAKMHLLRYFDYAIRFNIWHHMQLFNMALNLKYSENISRPY